MRINTYGVAKYTNKIRINHDKTTIFRHWADDQSQSSRRSAGIDRRILRYRADNSTVSCWWNFCFLLVELLFSPSGTFIFCWWNSCFVLMKLLFRTDETPASCREYRTLLLRISHQKAKQFIGKTSIQKQGCLTILNPETALLSQIQYYLGIISISSAYLKTWCCCPPHQWYPAGIGAFSGLLRYSHCHSCDPGYIQWDNRAQKYATPSRPWN